jgi:hypothetical protein
MATGTAESVAILRDAPLRSVAPQDEVSFISHALFAGDDMSVIQLFPDAS